MADLVTRKTATASTADHFETYRLHDALVNTDVVTTLPANVRQVVPLQADSDTDNLLYFVAVYDSGNIELYERDKSNGTFVAKSEVGVLEIGDECTCLRTGALLRMYIKYRNEEAYPAFVRELRHPSLEDQKLNLQRSSTGVH